MVAWIVHPLFPLSEGFREVFKDRLWSGCQDNAAADSAVAADHADGAAAGYYTCRYDYPVCNHTDGVTEKNLGYIKGITADGVPFEAELFETEDWNLLPFAIQRQEIFATGSWKKGQLHPKPNWHGLFLL